MVHMGGRLGVYLEALRKGKGRVDEPPGGAWRGVGVLYLGGKVDELPGGVVGGIP